MNRTRQHARRLLRLLPLLLPLWLLGCDYEEDDYTYVPPLGQGALIVDNWTWDDIDVYVNGGRVARVDDDEVLYADLLPGLYRVVLIEEDGRRSFGIDLDVVSGQQSILRVRTIEGSTYNVSLDFD